MEKTVNDQLADILVIKSIICDSQNGYLRTGSWTSHLIDLLSEITHNRD